MKERVWTMEEMIKGYQEMAELNLALAEDFAPLEAETATEEALAAE